MPITLTDLSRVAMIQEASNAVLRLQKAVRVNAETHKQWAVAQSVALPELQTMINNTIDSYERTRAKLRHFRDVTIPADPAFLTVGESLMLTLQSVGLVGQEVANEIDIFAVMPRNTYAEIIAACEYLITNVNTPISIWD